MKKFLVPILALISLGAFATPAFAVDQTQYEWQGTLQLPSNQPGSPPSNGVYTSPTTYPTSQACYSGLDSAVDNNYNPPRPLTVPYPTQFTCNCDTPISQQPSCPGYTAPAQATPPAAAPSSSAPAPTGPSGFVPLAPIPGLTDQTSANNALQNGIGSFLNQLYIYLIGIAAVLAIIEIIWGGIEIMGESVVKKGDGKKRIQQALLGLVLILAPVLVFTIINPAILNLSLSLPPIQQQGVSQSALNGSGSSGSQTTTTTNGVTQSVTGTHLQTATFSSNNPDANNSAAQAWVAQCKGPWNGIVVTSSCSTYTNGTCQNPPAAVAQCVLPASSPYSFVDVASGILNTVTNQYQLKPTDSSGEQYLASCQADNGSVCAQSIPSAQTCPNGLTLPSGAPNASGGGNCYQLSPLCIPNVSAALPGSVVGVVGGGVLGGPVGAVAGGVVGNAVGPVTVNTHANPSAAGGASCQGNLTFTP